MNSRLDWIDISKFLGVSLVVLGHMDSPYSRLIYSFHMPLFFFISGFFLPLNEKYSISLLRNAKKTFTPFFVFLSIALILEFIKRGLLGRPQINILHDIFHALYKMDYPALSNHYGFVLWFLPALFVSKSLCILILKYFKGKLITSSAIVILAFLLSSHIDLPFALDEGLSSLIWVYLGYVYFKYLQDSAFISISAFIAPILLLLKFNYPALNLALKEYSSWYLNIPWALLLIASILQLAKIIDKFKAISKTFSIPGKMSMAIYLFHVYTNNIAVYSLNWLNFGHWQAKLLLSGAILSIILILNANFKNRFIFKYV